MIRLMHISFPCSLFRNPTRTVPGFAACALFLVVLSNGLLADSDRLLTEQTRLEDVQKQIAVIQRGLEAKAGSQSRLEQQLSSAEKQLNDQHKSLRALKKKQQQYNLKLKQLNHRQDRLSESLQTQRQKLKSQLRTAYFMGGQGQLKVLLNQQDPSALARTVKYFDYLNHARMQVIDSTQTILAEIKSNSAEIEKHTRDLDMLAAASQRKYEEIKEIRGNRRAVLKKLKKEISENKQSVVKLKEDEVRIQELIASLTGIFSDIPPETDNVPFSQLKGRLPWPVEGKLLNAFGEAQARGDLNWQGIQIAAPGGLAVRAVSNGRVAFADWIPRFGLILLLDHNNGYMTLYAHNQTLYKETGDWVSSGEVIASVGDSGGGDRELLYFEIRHNGKPLNPAQWCTVTRT